MLPYELFNGYEAAHLAYAKTCGVEATSILDRRLQDGSWRRAPEQWVDLLQWMEWQQLIDNDEVKNRAIAFAQAIGAPSNELTTSRFTETLVDALLIFAPWACEQHPGSIPALAASLLNHIGPGEAGIVARILEAIPDQNDLVGALGSWLLRTGVAELRNPARQRLLLRLLLTVAGPAPLATAVRMVARDGPRLELNPKAEELTALWDRIERFDPNGPSPDEVCELLRRFAESAHGRECYPQPDRHPRCTRLLVQRWLRDDYKGAPFDEIAVICPPPPEDFDGVTLSALHRVALKLRLAPKPSFRERPTAAVWARLLSTALIRAVGGIRGLCNDPESRRTLQLISGWPKPAVGVEEALRECLAESEETHVELVRQILDAPGEAHLRVWSAVLALQEPAIRDVRDTPPIPESFQHHLRNLINTSWRPLHGLNDAMVFRGAKDVCFERLERDLQVDFSEKKLLIHEDYPRLLSNSVRPLEEQLALLSLYVVHEAIHHAQQIGEKDAVGSLRSTGNEQALMHLDLSADHAAALIVSATFPKWSLLWLKDIQGRSIADFPSTALHAFGSRMRKATRLAGLRLDYLVRRHMPDLEIGEGYVYAGLGPAGGPFHVLTSGPPVRLLLERKINDTQAKIVIAALERRAPSLLASQEAEPLEMGNPIERLDQALREVIGVK